MQKTPHPQYVEGCGVTIVYGSVCSVMSSLICLTEKSESLWLVEVLACIEAGVHLIVATFVGEDLSWQLHEELSVVVAVVDGHCQAFCIHCEGAAEPLAGEILTVL